MGRTRTAAAAILLAAGLLATIPAVTSGQVPTSHVPTPKPTPRWLLHAQRHPGSLSGTVQAQARPDVAAPRTRAGAAGPAGTIGRLRNVQMNDDSNPPLPQNETSVAYNVFNPLIAVAASNDYVSGGVAVMRTRDGGRTWRTTRITSVFAGTTDTCSGGDPAVAYSRRDHAFYVAQLCFFRTLPFSEVHIHKSVDNGATWTPGRQAARAATNFDYANGTVDDTIFNDKEYITVDNNPTSPHYGRLYVSYTKFHLLPDGSSDYCPIQLASTDNVPTANPALTVFQHTQVVPDNPGGNGLGESANQFSVPVVQRNGTLDIGYILEDCNSSLDFGFRFQKSRDGGATFLPSPVHVDKPGQFVDNPDPGDLLPPTAFRAPNTLSVAYSQTTGTLVFLYQNNVNRAVSKADISYQRSTDGGLTWSDAKFLSVGPGGRPARNDQFFPWAAADQKGKFYAIWFDRRLDPANRDIDTWQAESTSDGRSWKSFRISTRSWNPDLGFFSSGAFIGDYNGLAASTTAVYPVWTDGRNSAIERTGIGETDIFTNVERR
ncbi:MAG TPA: sialidase family protein [Actinomycetes bacterium]